MSMIFNVSERSLLVWSVVSSNTIVIGARSNRLCPNVEWQHGDKLYVLGRGSCTIRLHQYILPNQGLANTVQGELGSQYIKRANLGEDISSAMARASDSQFLPRMCPLSKIRSNVQPGLKCAICHFSYPHHISPSQLKSCTSTLLGSTNPNARCIAAALEPISKPQVDAKHFESLIKDDLLNDPRMEGLNLEHDKSSNIHEMMNVVVPKPVGRSKTSADEIEAKPFERSDVGHDLADNSEATITAMLTLKRGAAIGGDDTAIDMEGKGYVDVGSLFLPAARIAITIRGTWDQMSSSFDQFTSNGPRKALSGTVPLVPGYGGQRSLGEFPDERPELRLPEISHSDFSHAKPYHSTERASLSRTSPLANVGEAHPN
ncbi:hypothetical protein AC579_5370 [Pseudocercospora musae]|uniref:Uncharacterized protein n=1 Tax=Pseudocercospora musae TaxID=113226 RepID=A0A139H3W4_9PEZI|nr:hypothetical protein AC579_5370 [Pseudocercospora musae]